MNPPYRNQRIDELILNYHRNPGRFYYDTPSQGIIYFTQHAEIDQYIGSSRIKMVRRLSEIVARRIIDHLFQVMTRHTYTHRYDREQSPNLAWQKATTISDELLDYFIEAENQLLHDLQKHRPISNHETIIINDVGGIKMILKEHQKMQLITELQRMPDCTIIEEEHHPGFYNATNLIVCYFPDKENITSEPIGGRIMCIMQNNGKRQYSLYCLLFSKSGSSSKRNKLHRHL